MRFTVLAGSECHTLPAERRDGPALAPVDAPVLGWERAPRGWCRGDSCVPARVTADMERDGLLDVAAFLEAQDNVVADTEAGALADLFRSVTGPSAEASSRALRRWVFSGDSGFTGDGAERRPAPDGPRGGVALGIRASTRETRRASDRLTRPFRARRNGNTA